MFVRTRRVPGPRIEVSVLMRRAAKPVTRWCRYLLPVNSRTSRFLFIFSLVFAGEMIFSLPFHTTRYYRPTFLEVFSFSNTQLGDVFAFYGVLAMVSYYLGGPVADRFSPRGLMTVSLAATAAGGLYLSTISGLRGHRDRIRVVGYDNYFSFLGRDDPRNPRVGVATNRKAWPSDCWMAAGGWLRQPWPCWQSCCSASLCPMM